MEIRTVKIEDLYSLNHTIDVVCRERKYLATTKGFLLDNHECFLKNIIDSNIPQVIAEKNNHIVAWCDIIPKSGEGFTHVGYLGMGVLKEYRGMGLGRKILLACIDVAKDHGIEKIELEVFSDNKPAVQLYESTGFIVEGEKKNARKLDGNYQHISLYGLLIN